ncbi:MAG: hypothetical protein ACHQAY_13160 [Hyphomicrobiales bacterium]
MAAEVRRAAGTPIQQCLLTESLFEHGLGSLVLTRASTPYRVTLGSFLIDTFCLGIKDVVVRMIGSEELAMYIESMGAAAPLVPVDPSYARKLLGDLAAGAGSIGFPPHRDFPIAEQVFGDTNAAACDADFRFGRDGKPFYVPGPTESPSQIRRRIEHLRRTVSDDRFVLEARV